MQIRLRSQDVRYGGFRLCEPEPSYCCVHLEEKNLSGIVSRDTFHIATANARRYVRHYTDDED